MEAFLRGDHSAGALVALRLSFHRPTPQDRWLARELAETALTADLGPPSRGTDLGVRALLATTAVASTESVAERLAEARSAVEEELELAAAVRLERPGAIVGAYVHHDQRRAALVAVASGGEPSSVQRAAKRLAMHVVSRHPRGRLLATLEGDALDAERAAPWVMAPEETVAAALAREAGAPAEWLAFVSLSLGQPGTE